MAIPRKKYLLATPVRIGNNSYGAGFAWLTDDEARQIGLEVDGGEKPPKDFSKLGLNSQQQPGGVDGKAVADALRERGVEAKPGAGGGLGDEIDDKTKTAGGLLGDGRTSSTKGGGRAEGSGEGSGGQGSGGGQQ